MASGVVWAGGGCGADGKCGRVNRMAREGERGDVEQGTEVRGR